jgi:tellurite resistance protein TerC
MVLGPDVHTETGGSMILGAEELYRDHAPSRAVLQSVLVRLYTGADPNATWGDVLSDPAAHLPPHGIEGLEPRHHAHRQEATLFQEEDLTAWIVFTLVFFVLVIFDNFVLFKKVEKLSLLQSILYTTFWIAVAGMFGIYVWYTRGMTDAFSWGTGYLLEWMLSVDNLFVFHRIFSVFKTPDAQKHKPLFYGIIGAIVFRMIFFLIEEILLHHVTWMHLVFGLFLIYTGFKAVSMDDDDESPDQGAVFQFILSHIKYVDRYDDDGKFFTQVAVNKNTGEVIESARSSTSKPDLEAEGLKPEEVEYRGQATRLVLVVICLEVTDLVFAVDSVSAIVAQIPDLFLAYTACVFAMLGLRAMFFAIDELVRMFSLLSYGVAFILVFIGLKLILKSWIHIPPKFVCFILVFTLLMSVVASVVAEKSEDDEKDGKEDRENSTPELCGAR